MNRTFKKTLSIILTILMIVTTIPIAFAADEIPDFSDAKVLSTDVDGYLCIDGERIEISTNYYNEKRQLIPSGKYKLQGDMISNGYTAIIEAQENVIINLNGYKWTFGGVHNIILRGELSVYDLSEKETGKLVASTHWGNVSLSEESSVFNLYSGTLESIGGATLRVLAGAVNLYGGKLKSDEYTIECTNVMTGEINLDDVVLESGEGYAQIDFQLSNYAAETNIDVTDYTGDALEIDLTIDHLGKAEILKGIKSAEDAEKYKINVEVDYGYLFHEKTGYDEENGTKYVTIAQNAFTQQPTIDNNYTVDFNNPDVSFQWCEVEEKILGVYTVERLSPLFTYEFKAGDILKVSTDSEIEYVALEVGDERLRLVNGSETAKIIIDADETIEIIPAIIESENPVELEFTVIKETTLDGETDKTLQNPECCKNYWCKATVGEFVCISDTVVVGHDIIQVEEKAPTCTEIGWEAYEYCTACDYTTYVEIPAGHKEEAVKGYAATCESTGLTDGVKCSVCGEMLTAQETIGKLSHKDEDGDYKCDYGCGHEFEKPAEPEAPEDPSADCDHLCHSNNWFIKNIIWKIVRFFWKLFKMNPVCECGAAHY